MVPGDYLVPFVSAPGQEILVAFGNTDELRRVFINLLGSARKFSTKSASVKSQLDTFEESCRVRVVDSGPAIARTYLPKLGERFFRLDLSRDRASGGLRLGTFNCGKYRRRPRRRSPLQQRTRERNGSYRYSPDRA